MAAMFPTKLVIVSDDSDCAVLAATAAMEIAKKANSELHVVYVEPRMAVTPVQRLHEEVYGEIKQGAQDLLDEQVRRIKETGRP